VQGYTYIVPLPRITTCWVPCSEEERYWHSPAPTSVAARGGACMAVLSASWAGSELGWTCEEAPVETTAITPWAGRRSSAVFWFRIDTAGGSGVDACTAATLCVGRAPRVDNALDAAPEQQMCVLYLLCRQR